MKEQPDLVVFRLPEDDDGNKRFLAVRIESDGTLGHDAEEFSAPNGDPYNTLGFSELVLSKDNGSGGSTLLCSVEIVDKTTKVPVILHSDMLQIHMLFPDLLDEWQTV